MAYFPNATAGDQLDQQCGQCQAGGGGCPIYHVQMIYNYDQLKKGNEELRKAMNMLIDENGRCKMRLMLAPPKPKSDVPEWLNEAH